MMDDIIRDVDIVTSAPVKEDKIVGVSYKGNNVDRIISYRSDVSDDREGEGTKENPYSKKQLTSLIESDQINLSESDLVIKQVVADHKVVDFDEENV